MEPIATSVAPDITVVQLAGRLTVGNSSQRVEWFIEDLIKKGQLKLVLDVKELAYLDSAGLGILIASSGKAKSAGGQMRLAGVTPRVLEIFNLTGTDRVLLIDADVNASVAAFGGGAAASA